jgi:hypothetical protein
VNQLRIARLVPLLLMVLAIWACAYESKQEDLATDCLPVVFQMYGEIDPTWGATVIENQNYELSIKPEDTSYPLNEISVQVYEIGEGDRVLITELNRPNDSTDVLALNFTGPSTGRIFIKLIAWTGADGEDLGSFSIQLCEI